MRSRLSSPAMVTSKRGMLGLNSFLPKDGKSRLAEIESKQWWTRRDLNSQPLRSKRSALSS